MRGRRRLLGAGLAVLLLAVLAWLVPWSRASDGGDVVATVNGEPITREAFYRALERAVGEQVLDQLITETLVLQAASSLREPVTDAEVDETVASLRAAYPSEELFQAALAAYGLSEDDLARQVRLSLILDRLATQDVEVSDEEVAAYFQAHKEELAHPERVRARHILVKTLEEAEDIRKALAEGEDFAELAAEQSLDTGSKDRGGDIGFFTASDNLVASFKEAAFALEVDEISDPVESVYGYHIIQVTEREPARPAVLEEEAEQIRRLLVAERATPAAEILGALRSEARVDVHWERYRSLAASDPEEPQGED